MPRNPRRKWNRAERRHRRERIEKESVKVLRKYGMQLQRRKSCEEAAAILSQDDRIVSVTADDITLSMETSWITSIPIKGSLYYIGRFAITINPASSQTLCIKWLDKGCESVPALYAYSLIGFCFGIRESYLKGLIQRKECEYLAASYGILDSLSHVNPGDVKYIQDHYRKVLNSESERRSESWMISLFRR